MTLDAHERTVMEWLAEREDGMVKLLERIVNIDSRADDPKGVDKVGDVIKAHLEAAGCSTEVLPQDRMGYAMRAWNRDGTWGAPRADHILLLGHRDTVFPPGEAHRRPFSRDGVLGQGPGVVDMKAGLVLNTYILQAFGRLGGNDFPLVALYTSDEEIASPDCREVIKETATGARAVFNTEPGRPEGTVTTRRKGAMFLTFEVEGVASHSGAAHDKGVSAIQAMAKKVQALHALTDYERGTTVNVGKIEGGQSVNTVAPLARAEVDIRFVDAAEMEAAVAAVTAVIEANDLDGSKAKILDQPNFPPLVPTEASERLLKAYQAAATDLDQSVEAISGGGSADSGFTSMVGAPTLCGCGPLGGMGHSPDEFVHLDSLVPRAQAIALTILRLKKD